MLLIGVLFVVACTPKQITFEQGYKEILKLDEKYDGDFRREIIMNGGLVTPLANISGFISDLDQLKLKYSKMPDSNDTSILINLTQTRIYMLEAERYFQLFINIGPDGLVINNFTCSQIPAIAKATGYMDDTANSTKKAFIILDDILAWHPSTRATLGTGDNKIAFYSSDLFFLDKESRRNRLSVKKYCGVQIG